MATSCKGPWSDAYTFHSPSTAPVSLKVLVLMTLLIGRMGAQHAPPRHSICLVLGRVPCCCVPRPSSTRSLQQPQLIFSCYSVLPLWSTRVLFLCSKAS